MSELLEQMTLRSDHERTVAAVRATHERVIREAKEALADPSIAAEVRTELEALIADSRAELDVAEQAEREIAEANYEKPGRIARLRMRKNARSHRRRLEGKAADGS